MKRIRFFTQILKCSRIMKWLAWGFAIIGVLQAARDEFLSTEQAERLRIVNFLPHWTVKTWVVIVLVAIILTLGEGIWNWYVERVAPILGPAGSLQSDAVLASVSIAQCVFAFVEKHGPPPSSIPHAENSPECQWDWEKRLCAECDGACKGKVRVAARRLEADKLNSVAVNDFIALASFDERTAFAAAAELFHLSLLARNAETIKNMKSSRQS